MSRFFDDLAQQLREAAAERYADTEPDLPTVRPRRGGRVRGRRAPEQIGAATDRILTPVPAHPRHRRGRRLATGALLALALASAIGTAVPSTRAAIGDAIGSVGTLSTYFDEADQHAAPDSSLHAPRSYLSFKALSGGTGVLAETDGVRLLVKQYAGLVFIGIANAGNAAGSYTTPARWRAQFAGHAIFLLRGAIEVPGPRGPRRAVAALVSEAVTSVELRYRRGPPDTDEEIDGGFVLLADIDRRPYEIVARNAAGEQLERVAVR